MKAGLIQKTLAMSVALQMAISPLAMAQSMMPSFTGDPTDLSGSSQLAPSPLGPQNTTPIGGNVGIALQTFKYVADQLAAQQAQQASVRQQQMLFAQLNPSMCGNLPCHDTIFPNCNVLNTKPNIVEPLMCTQGIDMNDSGAAIKAGEALGYYNHFAQMENIYDNFSKDANQASNYGLTCLNGSKQALQRALDKRVSDITDLINRLEKQNALYKQQADVDRKKVEESMALLNGKSFKPRGEAILDQMSVKFADQFNDPACLSVRNSDELNGKGSDGGLNAIQAMLSQDANAKVTGKGGFSAMEFNSQISASVVADITKVAERLGKDIASRGPGALSESPSSTYGISSSPAFADVLADEKNEVDRVQGEVSTSLEGYDVPASFNQDLFKDGTGFTTKLVQYERDQKNACLKDQVPFQELNRGSLHILNGSSKFANRNRDNEFTNFLMDTLKNNSLSAEAKQKMLEDFVSKRNKTSNVGQYTLDITKSATIGDTTYNPGQSVTPLQLVQKLVELCQNKFDNDNSTGHTGRETLNQLNNARNKYVAFRSSLGDNVRKDIYNKLVNCDGGGQASGVASCSANDLSTAGPNFCVKRATTCANNMRNCLAKAETKIKTETAKRDASVWKYKTAMQAHKQSLLNMYSAVEQITSLDGLNIAASLKQGMTLPTNLQFDFKESDRRASFLPGLENLEMEDPDAYFNLMKKNLLALQKEVTKQNEKVMNGDGSDSDSGGVNGHIAKVMKNLTEAKAMLTSLKPQCLNAYTSFVSARNNARAQALQQQQQLMQKNQEDQMEYCADYNTLMASPTCGNVDDLGTTALRSAAKAGDRNAVAQLSRMIASCPRNSSDTAVAVNLTNLKRKAKVANLSQLCSSDGDYAETTLCKANTMCEKVKGLTDRESIVKAAANYDSSVLDIASCKAGDTFKASECTDKINDNFCLNDKLNSLVNEDEFYDLFHQENTKMAMTDLGERRSNLCVTQNQGSNDEPNIDQLGQESNARAAGN